MNKVQSTVGGPQSLNFYAAKEKNQFRNDPPLFFLIMRFNFKVALLLLTSLTVITIFLLYSLCNQEPSEGLPDQLKIIEIKSNFEDIDCDINGGEKLVKCKTNGSEIYVPFNFLSVFYDVSGKLSNDGKSFKWFHSQSKIYHPKSKYDPRGVFAYFENYNVEVRGRVKCIGAVDGVPVSTQWDSQGYHYPTQIAQFGLAHYSKNLTEPEPRVTLFEDSDSVLGQWRVPTSGKIVRNFVTKLNSHVLQFKTSDQYSEGIQLEMEHVMDFVMKVDLMLNGNSSLTISIKNRENFEEYFIHFITGDFLMATQENNIYYGIGGIMGEWKRLTRDLIVDLHKGLNYAISNEKLKIRMPRSKLKIISVILRGSGAIDNLTLATTEHIQQFYHSAEWFVKNQDPESGGWPISVKREIASGFLQLEPGWYSAMGQGQAISVLARAYHHSGGDPQFLNVALNALKPFRVSSVDGGVLATFINKYHWYEEYPTRPPLFVLNGFIFSLLGLYDLMTIAPVDQAQEAEFLFNEGMTTLKNLLPFFDTGSGTVYDLRHFTLGVAPNIARWDYHVTHINQLLLLSTIDDAPLFKTTAERWIGYMNGKRAHHN
ncbi:hypothetical protein ABEB36_007079 [Hypothenemus hampei]|uniref:heparosan-N-sulfate-glucuronate 5-epimerase n=1 Tax=Hypothenemus hampei TaxID=57062 RepID=A0ABD1ESS4_HYPHA